MHKKNATLCFLYISAPIKATEIVFIWEDRGDKCLHFIIGPEKRTESIFIKTSHQGIHPQPHLASLVDVQKQLSRNKKGFGVRS